MNLSSPTGSTAQIPATGWCLRLVDGTMAWSNWPLSETPLLVGRGLGCRMRLDDPRVSRIQCEVLVSNAAPRLRNRSESSPTRVNGMECSDTTLRLGDLIEFADFRLIVDCLPAPGDMPVPGLSVPTTRAFDDTPFHSDTVDATATGSLPAFASDLLLLFHFSRQLAQADSLDTVVSEIRSHLAQRLRPDSRWVAWRVRADGDITLYPAATQRDTDSAPFDALRQACSSGSGVLQSTPAGSLVAAPLLHGGAAFGALCVQRAPGRDYSEKHLHYLLAVAECAAPHIRAAERLEQWRRDAVQAGLRGSGEARLLGSSPPMNALRESIRWAALSRGNVLLLGETGSGKELAARMLHDLSARATGPFVTVNCPAIPSELFESEMFGHERGSFTGASARHKGFFEQAHGGTLVLDELGDLSLTNQARLLRAVDTGTIRRVGSENDLRVDVRIISATNRPLPDETNTWFRMDLYHRLAGMVIHLPTLRERKMDIPELAHHFLVACSNHAPARPVALTPEAVERLQSYDWPGNIRELRSVVERACFLATGRLVSEIEPLASERSAVQKPVASTVSLDKLERRHLESVLTAHDGDVAAAAKALGMPKSTLYYRLSKHGIALGGRRRLPPPGIS